METAREARRRQNQHGFPAAAVPSPLTELFVGLLRIPGWFTVDDCAHFEIILRLQTLTGVVGDLVDIGAYFGRSAVMLGRHLQAGERLIVSDVFDGGGSLDFYPAVPTVEILRLNLVANLPGLDLARVDVRMGRSVDLDLGFSPRGRFAHVDGGHTRDEALHDLELCYAYMVPGGILAIDDVEHINWPEVSVAVGEFRRRHPELLEVADLNRFGERGRKLYLMKPLPSSPR